MQHFNRWNSLWPWLLLIAGLGTVAWQAGQRRRNAQQLLTAYSVATSSPEPMTWPTQPLVSVLVAAWNEEGYLAEFLRSFAALTYPHKELILCAGGTDQTYQIAQRWSACGITLLHQQAGEGKYRALQRSLSHAHGTIIFLTDADCVLNNRSFQRLIYPIVTGTEMVVNGIFEPLLQQQRQPFVAAQWLMQQAGQLQTATPNAYSSFLVGANCALSRTLVESCWQATLDNSIGEDYYLALEIQQRGIRIRQCRESYVQTRYPNTLYGYLMTKSRWHRSWLLQHYRTGDRRWVRNMLSACRFGVLLALPLLPFLLGPLGLIIWVVLWARQLVPYWVNNQFVATPVEPGQSTRVRLHHLFLLMLADFCSWAIIPFQLLVPLWRRRW